MIATKVQLQIDNNYNPIIPIYIPNLDEVRIFAHQLHTQGLTWTGEAFSWSAEYTSEQANPPLDSQMEFTPASFCIGESGIWFFSLTWENGKDQEPFEFLDDRNLVKNHAGD